MNKRMGLDWIRLEECFVLDGFELKPPNQNTYLITTRINQKARFEMEYIPVKLSGLRLNRLSNQQTPQNATNELLHLQP